MKKEGWFLLTGIVLLNILVIILFLFNNPFTDPFNFFIRFFSIIGLVAMFVSATLTPFQKELYQVFRKPFIKIHHSSTIIGLISITLHPLIHAINIMVSFNFAEGLKVFVPNFTSAFNFFSYSGRFALIIIYVALIGALIRKVLKKGWRWIHSLNYFALIFGVIHGILLGSDFYNFNSAVEVGKLFMTILFLIMIIAMLTAFIIKRIKMVKDQRKKQTIKEITEKNTQNTTITEQTEK